MPESEYDQRFINQYVKIPQYISARIKAEYAAEYEDVRHCLCLIVANLLAYGKVAYSRRKQFYTKNKTQHYTWANMLRAVDILVGQGYVASEKGFKGKGYERGLSSTLNPLPRLRQEFTFLDKVELDIESLPLLTVNGKPIYDSHSLHSIGNDALSSIPHLPTIYGTAHKLNREYFNRMTIDYQDLALKEEYIGIVGLTRVFKDGGVGRWFQKGGRSYQTLSEDERTRILLNGEYVAELDYPAMHPHILYSWEGGQCPEDFYERIVNVCGCNRFIAKSVTLTAINASDYRRMVDSINLEKGREAKANQSRTVPKPILYDELKKLGLPSKQVIESFIQAHPVIAKYLFSGLANRLMLVESNIMTSVLLRLMEQDIPTLPVHDSLVFPLRHRETVKQVMEDEYQRQTHFSITVV